MMRSNIYDVMKGIAGMEEISFDNSMLNLAKIVQLQEASKYIDERCSDCQIMVLCSFDGVTYLIDDECNLWDVNKDNELSMLLVGHLGYGVDGFVVDIAQNAVLEKNMGLLEELEGCLSESFFAECIEAIEK